MPTILSVEVLHDTNIPKMHQSFKKDEFTHNSRLFVTKWLY